MHWDASSLMYSRVIGCVGCFQTSDTPTRVTQPWDDQSPAYIPAAVDYRTFIFSQSHLVALCAASVINLMVLFSANPIYPQFGDDSAELPACKAPASHLDRLTVGAPALPPALLCQLLVLGAFSLLGLVHPLLTGYNQFYCCDSY